MPQPRKVQVAEIFEGVTIREGFFRLDYSVGDEGRRLLLTPRGAFRLFEAMHKAIRKAEVGYLQAPEEKEANG